MDTSSLMEQILSGDNLNRAYLQVVRNKGAEGVDGMKYTELKEHLKKNGESIKEQLRTRKYKPQPVRRVEIPKPDGGVRNLGVPTVTDRFIQQAIAQVLTPKVSNEIQKRMKELTCRSWGVSNSYKIEKLNQLIRGWINYFKIGSMKTLCKELDGNIRYRLRMCIWKHWKTPQNRAQNLMKLDVPRWAAFNIAYCGDKYARLARNGWVHKAISTKRLTLFGLVSMLDYYTERCVTC